MGYKQCIMYTKKHGNMLKQNKSHIGQNPKGKGDIPFTGQTGYRHGRSFESLCNRGQNLAAHRMLKRLRKKKRDTKTASVHAMSSFYCI